MSEPTPARRTLSQMWAEIRLEAEQLAKAPTVPETARPAETAPKGA